MIDFDIELWYFNGTYKYGLVPKYLEIDQEVILLWIFAKAGL